MPLQILQEDITNIECDAIVNSTNQLMIPGGGIDKLIHNLAGQELKKACEKIGRLEIGQAVITPAFKLPVKFIIHTVGPYWLGGDSNEKEMLISCYKECLALAKGTKCESVAFPLISSGCYDYPKQEVLKVAITTIKEFLQNNELMVYLVVYDKNSYSLNEELFKGMEKYIESNYENFENPKIDGEIDRFIMQDFCERKTDRKRRGVFACENRYKRKPTLPPSHWKTQSVPTFECLDDLKEQMYKGFAQTLFDFIEQKNIDDVECYKKANVSRQTWHKIVSDKNYNPTKNTILSFAIALELTLQETQTLLATAGYILSKSSLFDVIIMYCILKGIYDVLEIDSILFQYDQPTLFFKE